MPENTELNEFVTQYFATLMWSSNDEEDPNWDSYDESNLSETAKKKIANDCAEFLSRNEAKLEGQDLSQAAHDLALTRNGHGAGFWDGDWPVLGDHLTKESKRLGEQYPYLGDDGLIYVHY